MKFPSLSDPWRPPFLLGFLFVIPVIVALSNYIALPLTLILCLIFLTLATKGPLQETTRLSRSFFLIGVIFVGWCALSAIWSLDPDHSLKRAAKLLLLLGVGYYFLGRFPLKTDLFGALDAHKRLIWLGGAVLIALGIGWYRILDNEFLVYFGHGPSQTFILMSAFALAYFLPWSKKYQLISAGIILLYLSYAAFGLNSTAKLVVALAPLVALITYVLPRLSIIAAMVILSVFFLSPLLGCLSGKNFYGSLIQWMVAENVGIKNSFMHRLYIYEFASNAICQNPWFGWGAGISKDLPGADQIIEGHVSGTKQYLSSHPHNFYLQIWVETGLVGAVLVWSLIMTGLMMVMKQAQDRLFCALLMGCLASYFFFALVSYSVWASWFHASAIFVFFIFLIGHKSRNETSLSG